MFLRNWACYGFSKKSVDACKFELLGVQSDFYVLQIFAYINFVQKPSVFTQSSGGKWLCSIKYAH